MRGMDHAARAPRTAALLGSVLLCSVFLTGCPGDSGVQSPFTGCAAGRELRDLTAESSSATEFSEVRSTYQLLSRSRPPAELSEEWITVTNFMWDATTTLQGLDDPGDQEVFEATWEPLAAELEDSGSVVGRSAQAIISYTDENCTATAPPTYGD